MDPNEFVENFASIFDDVDSKTLNHKIVFREIDEWSSLNALLLLAMVEEEYDVRLNNQDIRCANTIGDLYTIVRNKKG